MSGTACFGNTNKIRKLRRNVEASRTLLESLWNKDEKAVAEGTDKATKKHTCVIEEVYKNS